MAGSSDQQSGTHTFLYNKLFYSLVNRQARNDLTIKQLSKWKQISKQEK